MTELKKVSDEELEAELERRKKVKNAPPVPLDQPNFEPLRKMIIEGTRESIENESEDDDFSHYVYEAAMDAVYGKNFWVWRNKQDW